MKLWQLNVHEMERILPSLFCATFTAETSLPWNFCSTSDAVLRLHVALVLTGFMGPDRTCSSLL